MRDLAQELKRASVKYPEEIDTAAETSGDVYVDVRRKGKRLAMCAMANLTATKTAIVQLTCATDAAGTGAEDVTGKTFTLTGGTDSNGSVSFDPTDLDLTNSKFFVGVDITTNQNNDDICAWLEYIPDHVDGTDSA